MYVFTKCVATAVTDLFVFFSLYRFPGFLTAYIANKAVYMMTSGWFFVGSISPLQPSSSRADAAVAVVQCMGNNAGVNSQPSRRRSHAPGRPADNGPPTPPPPPHTPSPALPQGHPTIYHARPSTGRTREACRTSTILPPC